MKSCVGKADLAMAKTRFVSSRTLRRAERQVCMPMVELVNHAPSAQTFSTGEGVSIQGVFEDEILVRYRRADAVQMFVGWGFTCREPLAYSLSLMRPHADRAIAVRRNLDTARVVDGLNLPQVTRHADGPSEKLIILSHLLLTHSKQPEQPRIMMRRLMEELSLPDADALFDGIREANRETLTGLRDSLAEITSGVAASLRAMCDDQLETLSRGDRF
jgi:hypothetical protein